MGDQSLPAGVERRDIAGVNRLATQGAPISDEATDGQWRGWDPHRSKLAAMLELGMDTGLEGGETVLYLGAASGTTVSHVADFAGPVYAIEFAARPMRDLVEVAANRSAIVPLLKDARQPETYAHVVEAGIDVIVQDVATRGQAQVALANRPFLDDDGRLLLAVKARSEDVTRNPRAVFDDVTAALATEYSVLERTTLERYHGDHLGVVARPA